MDYHPHSHILHYMVIQYLLRKRIKKCKKSGKKKVEKELNQLRTKSNFVPMNVASMSE